MKRNKDIKTCLIFLVDDHHKWNSYNLDFFQDFEVNKDIALNAENGLFVLQFEEDSDIEYGDFGSILSHYSFPVFVGMKRAKWYQWLPYIWYQISKFFITLWSNFIDLFRPIWCVSEENNTVGHYITDSSFLPYTLFILALGKRSNSYKIYHWFAIDDKSTKLRLYKDIYGLNKKSRQVWQQQ